MTADYTRNLGEAALLHDPDRSDALTTNTQADVVSLSAYVTMRGIADGYHRIACKQERMIAELHSEVREMQAERTDLRASCVHWKNRAMLMALCATVGWCALLAKMCW